MGRPRASVLRAFAAGAPGATVPRTPGSDLRYRFCGERKGRHAKGHLARLAGWMRADGCAGLEDCCRSGTLADGCPDGSTGPARRRAGSAAARLKDQMRGVVPPEAGIPDRQRKTCVGQTWISPVRSGPVYSCHATERSVDSAGCLSGPCRCRGQHPDGRAIGADRLGRPGMAPDGLGQGLRPRAGVAFPVGQRGADPIRAVARSLGRETR